MFADGVDVPRAGRRRSTRPRTAQSVRRCVEPSLLRHAKPVRPPVRPLQIWLFGLGRPASGSCTLDSKAERLKVRYGIAVTAVGLASARDGFSYDGTRRSERCSASVPSLDARDRRPSQARSARVCRSRVRGGCSRVAPPGTGGLLRTREGSRGARSRDGASGAAVRRWPSIVDSPRARGTDTWWWPSRPCARCLRRPRPLVAAGLMTVSARGGRERGRPLRSPRRRAG